MSARLRLTVAAAAGLLLATLPFLRYVHFGPPHEPHADHEPRHGGQLGMSGDHHLEIVRRSGRLEIFVSDARRRIVDAAGGRIAFDGGEEVILEKRGGRFVTADRPAARRVGVVVLLEDGTRVEVDFEL